VEKSIEKLEELEQDPEVRIVNNIIDITEDIIEYKIQIQV
jgi:hypothetical protein